MTTLHLMVGLPCAGKTTYAKELEKKEKAIRFTPDEWQLKLFGQDYEEDVEEHNTRHTNIEEIIWEVAKRALELGTSAILDFGLWGRSERDFFRAEAKKLKVKCKIHYLDLEIEELKSRAYIRNEESSTAMHFPPEQIEEWATWFQRPDEAEMALFD